MTSEDWAKVVVGAVLGFAAIVMFTAVLWMIVP